MTYPFDHPRRVIANYKENINRLRDELLLQVPSTNMTAILSEAAMEIYSGACHSHRWSHFC